MTVPYGPEHFSEIHQKDGCSYRTNRIAHQCPMHPSLIKTNHAWHAREWFCHVFE